MSVCVCARARHKCFGRTFSGRLINWPAHGRRVGVCAFGAFAYMCCGLFRSHTDDALPMYTRTHRSTSTHTHTFSLTPAVVVNEKWSPHRSSRVAQMQSRISTISVGTTETQLVCVCIFHVLDDGDKHTHSTLKRCSNSRSRQALSCNIKCKRAPRIA